MTLHFESGDPINADSAVVPGGRIRVVNEQGKTMFHIKINGDGRSIDVRGVEVIKVGSVVYSSALDVRPRVENEVTILVRRYSDL